MGLFLKTILGAVGPATLSKFKKECGQPFEIQEKLLLSYIRMNEQTQYGKDHDFDKIHSFADFQKIIPVSTYEDFRPYVDRAVEGEPARLSAEKPVMYATTSGTTGKPKFIPVTKGGKAAKSQLMRIWLAGLFRDHPGFVAGRTLAVVSPEAEWYTKDGTPCGAESGHGYKNMPPTLQHEYAVPYEVYAISDYEAKYYTLLRIAAADNITFLYSCNPSTILLMADRLGKNSESIIRDVRDGTLCSDFQIPYETALKLKPYLKANPARARFLEQAAAKAGGDLLPKHIWPDLAVICCWKGGSVGSYLQKFPQFFPEDVAVRDIGYFSSEFRGSVPLSDDGPEGPLAIQTNVYEFYPAERDEAPTGADLLTVDQLEKGKQYYIYVTTAVGLCRYDMNDIIEVTDFYEKTPLIRFVQKGKGVISFTGEKLYESQVIDAMDKALKGVEGDPEFIAAIGEMDGDEARYVFLTEFGLPISEDRGKAILNDIEKELCAINVEYECKRKSKRLAAPILRIVKAGEFDRFRKRSVEGGKNDGQFKILKLTKDTKFIDNFEIEKVIGAPIKTG